MVAEHGVADRVEADDVERVGERRIEEGPGAVRGAGIVDDQADIDVVGDRADAIEHVRAGEVEREGADLDAAFGAEVARDLVERRLLAGDQHEVDADLGEPRRDTGADAFRSAGDDGPGAVGVGIDHGGFSQGGVRRLRAAAPRRAG